MKKIIILQFYIFILINFAYASSFTVSSDSSVTIYRVQVKTVMSEDSAEAIKQELLTYDISTGWVFSSATGWRVVAGIWPTRSEATATRNLIQSLGYSDAFIITRSIPYSQAISLNLPLITNPYRQALTAANQNWGSPTTLFIQAVNNWTQALINRADTTNLVNIIPLFAQVIHQSPNSTQGILSRRYMGQIYAHLYTRLRRANISKEISHRVYLEGAVDALNEFVSLNPNSAYAPLAQKQIGDCLHVLSNYHTDKLRKTAEAYQKVFTNYSTSNIAPEAHLQYAGVLFEMAANGSVSWDTVRAELSNVQTLYPNAPRQVKSRAMAMTPEIYYYQSNFPAMLEGASSTLQVYSDVTVDASLSHYLIGRAYLHLQDYSNAKTEFENLLATYQDNTAPDETEWALAGFTDLNSQDPMVSLNRSGALLGIALCCNFAGDSTGFQTAIQQVLTRYPNYQETKAIHKYFGISADTTSPTMLVNPPAPIPWNLTAQAGGD